MKKYIYSLVIAMLVSTLAIGAEVRKVTQEDIELGPATDTVTSAGGHVGHKIPRYWDNSAFSDNLTLYGNYSGTLIDARSHSSFALALDNAANKTLLIASTVTISDNTTIPSTVSVLVLRGGSFSIASGKVLTINGPFQSGAYTVFSDSGTVRFGLGSIAEAYIEWWGGKADAEAIYGGTSTGTDSATAFNAAVAALKSPTAVDNPGSYSRVEQDYGNRAKIKLLTGNYLLKSKVDMTDAWYFDIEGSGMLATKILHMPTDNNTDCFYYPNPAGSSYQYYNSLSDLTVASVAAGTRYLVFLDWPSEFRMNRVRLQGGSDTLKYATSTLYISDATRLSFRDCIFQFAAGNGVHIVAGTTTSFNECYFGYNDNNGLYTTDGVSLRSINSTFESNAGYGYDFVDGQTVLFGSHFEVNELGDVRAGYGTTSITRLTTIGSWWGNTFNSAAVPSILIDNAYYVSVGDVHQSSGWLQVTANTKSIEVFGSPVSKTRIAYGYTVGFDNVQASSADVFSGTAFFGIDGIKTVTINNLSGRTEINQESAAVKITLTDNTTIAYNQDRTTTTGGAHVPKGTKLKVILVQDGTGGRTVGWAYSGSNLFQSNYSDTGNTANKRCIVDFIYDGANFLGTTSGWF
jgi:hypothetical protein